jgi:uncharacterized repeat protein (TIGR03803 family)
LWVDGVTESFVDIGTVAGPIALYQGQVYGTYYLSTGTGAVYVYNPVTGLASVVYEFGTNDTFPMSGVTADSAGNLYGTTLDGGAYGQGTVFKLTRN